MSYGVVSKDLSLSEYKNYLLDLGFRNVYDNHSDLVPDKIYDNNISLWVHQDKGCILDLVGSSNGTIIHSASLHYELETKKSIEKDEVVREWMKEYLDCDGFRLMPSSVSNNLIRHVKKNIKSYLFDVESIRKTVISDLSKYLSRMDDIDDAFKEIDDSGKYNDVVNPIHINQSWVHFEKHPFYSALNEHLSVSEVKSIFGIFD